MINLEITIPAFAHSTQEAEISESLVKKWKEEKKKKYLLLVSIYSLLQHWKLPPQTSWMDIPWVLFVGVFVYSTVRGSQKITCRSQFSLSIVWKCSSVGRMLVQRAQNPEFSSQHCINWVARDASNPSTGRGEAGGSEVQCFLWG